MKQKLLPFIFFISFSFVCFTTYSQDDTDGDGTFNNLDQDEDNDGVPDELDGCSTIDIANTIGIGNPIVTNSSYPLEETTITYTTTDPTAIYGYVAGNQGDAIKIQGNDDFTAQLQMSFSTPVQNLTFKLTDFDNYEEIMVNAYDQSNNLINLSDNNAPFLGSFVDRTGNLIKSISTGTNSEGDDEAADITGAAYLYIPGEVSRIVFDIYFRYSGSMRITELNYCLKDTDNDGVLDFLDIDSDNDGIPDIVEAGGVDTNGDGYVDNITDNNGNGIPDIYDFRCTNGVAAIGYAANVNNSTNTTNATNALNAGDLNYSSIGSGGALELGFTDVIPAGNNIILRHIRQSGAGQIPFKIERSIDGISYFNSQTFTTSFNGSYEVLSYDLIGVDTQYIKITNLSTETLGVDYVKYNFGAFSNCSGVYGKQILNLDTDTDGLTNAQDLDSDGDGIFDIIEAYSVDTDGDGLADGFTDTDTDGFNDNFDGDIGNDGTPENSASALILTGTDSDSDGVPNTYPDANFDNNGFSNPYDIDSDDDGIPDNIEAQPTIGYLVPSGAINSKGLNTAYLSGLTPEDTDGDGTPDYIDLDSDNDVTLDIDENGDSDPFLGSDSDGDGLDDNFDDVPGTSDVNDEVTTGDSTDLTASFGDVDNDILSGGDLDYRDLFDVNPPVSATIDFDGDDDYLSTSAFLDGLQEVTLMAWVKINPLSASSTQKTIVGEDVSCRITLDGGNQPAFHIRGNDTPTIAITSTAIPKGEWHHITGTFSGITGEMKLFVDGAYIITSPTDFTGKTIDVIESSSNGNFEVGKYSRQVALAPDQQYFFGAIDEVRVFDKALSDEQVQQIVYQEIENNVGVLKGSTIDKNIEGPLPLANLLAYYPMTNIVTGRTLDYSSNSRNLTLNNITTIQPQTAPMPYETVADGPWITEGTWLHGDVWDIEDVTNNKDWSIVQIHNNVTTSNSHMHLGLFIDAGNTLTVGDIALDNQDFEINNTWYLQLDGTLDLQDDSQLVQGINSDLITSATGKILRRQEGNLNYYWYNYWSSPVGATVATVNANTDFNIDMIKAGNGGDIGFTSAYNDANKISRYWLYTFQNGRTYYDWDPIDENTLIAPGVGYTQKGTSSGSGDYQYLFEGKPNNGTILLEADDVDGDSDDEHLNESPTFNYTSTLIGNPYPSALNAKQFIADNGPVDPEVPDGTEIISGTIYVWEQWAGTSHNLDTYEGGYGTINYASTERAYQWNDPSQTILLSAKKPTFYIPVGQGFFVEVIKDGDPNVLSDTDDIEFNNGQRVFVKESAADGDPNNGSLFFRNSQESSSSQSNEDTIGTVRLQLNVSNGNSRSFVLAFSEAATDGYDYGYDARTIDPQDDDLNSFIGDEKMIIQTFAPITSEKIVDLIFNSTGTYNYTIEMTEISNIPEDQEIYLRDNLTGTYFDLRSGAYSFSSEVNAEDTERFDIVFQSGDTLSNEEFINDNTIIFVNNTEDMLYIKGLSTQAKQLSITNMLGQTLKTYNNVNNQILENGINISDLSSGVYMVTIKTDQNQTISKKVIFD